MTRYVALLRGINVSGQKIIKMETLREYFAISDFKNITSYIQSGNVLFDTAEKDEAKLRLFIETELCKSLGYSVTVILRSIEDLKEAIADNPFLIGAIGDERVVSITFMTEAPKPDRVKSIPEEINGDELKVIGKNAYIFYKRYSDCKYTNALIEKKFGVLATTRNWATVNKLITL